MVKLRRMREADVLGVMEIETRVSPAPWSYGIFSDCIKVGYDAWVYEDSEEIIGYGLFSIGVDEAHILQLAIKPERQRQGLGRKMLTYFLGEIALTKVKSAYLEVRISNEHAFELYQEMGFKLMGQRKDYYQTLDGREDALILEYTF